MSNDTPADREALRCELARLHSDRTSLRDQMEQAVAETRKLQEQVLQGINARRALKASVCRMPPDVKRQVPQAGQHYFYACSEVGGFQCFSVYDGAELQLDAFNPMLRGIDA